MSNGKTDHDWYIIPPIPDGTYEIVATTTGNCLDVTGLTDGSLAQLHPYTGSANQKWSVHNFGNGNFSIRNANGGRSPTAPAVRPATVRTFSYRNIQAALVNSGQ